MCIEPRKCEIDRTSMPARKWTLSTVHLRLRS